MPRASTPAALPRRLEYVRLDEVRYAPRNPKRHDRPAINRAIEHHGFVEVPAVDERTGRLVAGHGRHAELVAMRDAGQSPPEGVVVDTDGMWLMPWLRGWASRSDADAETYLIGSNHITTAGGWDDEEFLTVARDLDAVGLMETAGLTREFVDQLLESTGNPFDWGGGRQDDDEDTADVGEDDEADRGELLSLAGVTVGEPDIPASLGQVWELGEHVLAVIPVHTGWETWAPLLRAGALFWPYPTPLAPFAAEAATSPVVMVQPNTYLAGWLLTKWWRITGSKPVLRGAA